MPWVDKLSEPAELRRCIRDLVALSNLPALWAHYSPNEIVDSLGLALLSILKADFIYIALPLDREEPTIEAAYLGGAKAPATTVRAIAAAIPPDCLRRDGCVEVIANPLGTGMARIACTSIGIGRAILVSGSVPETFPTETRRRLLNIVANEAAVALQRCEVEAEEWRFMALVDRSSDFVAFSDLNGRPQYVNPSGFALVGLTAAELVSLNVFDFVSPADRRRVREDCWPTALRDRSWIGELNFRNFTTGEVLPFLVEMSRIDHPRSARPMNVAIISRDLTGQKQAEFELRRLNDSLERRVESRTAALVAEIAQRKRADARSQELQFTLSHAGRLSAAGQMAAALAHELSQPLAAVTNSANAARRLLAQARSEQIETVQEILNEIAGQSLRAGQILRRLRDFVTRGESEKQVEDIELLIKDASAFARTGLETLDVDLQFIFDPAASSVFANRIQIQQVLVNLLRNALEALGGFKEPQLLVTTKRLDSETIEIIVVDNGPGLPAEIVNHLFEPFVSTRPDGMGLGLSICRSIVEAHNGVLRYEPNPPGGSVFRITLPFTTEARQDHARQEHDLYC
jgi:PAS domain S-box-containing protein